MDFNWEEFKRNKFIVHCKTIKEMKNFLMKASNYNIYAKQVDNPENYKDKLCFNYEINRLWFGEIDGYKKYLSNIKIVEWSDYMEQEEKQPTVFEQTVKLLGLEDKEKFKIDDTVFMFNSNKLIFLDNHDRWRVAPANTFLKLIQGYYKIDKLPKETEFKVGDKFLIPEITVLKSVDNLNNYKKYTSYRNVKAELLKIIQNEDDMYFDNKGYYLNFDDNYKWFSKEELSKFKRI